MSETTILEINRKKTELNAQNGYQYQKLEQAGFYFVPCTVKEAHDEVCFSYDLDGMSPLPKPKQMREVMRYGILAQAVEAMFACREITFSLRPDNLYLDRQDRLRILERDLDTGKNEELAQLQALGGYLFQTKYSYEDYIEGGEKLLLKNRKTQFLMDLTSLFVAKTSFLERQEMVKIQDREEMTFVNRSRYRRTVVLMWAALAGCAVLGAGLWYQQYRVIRPQASALLAERAYMESDLVTVSDALAEIPIEQMDVHEKYLLASVSIRGQSVDSFDQDTKSRLLSTLSYNGNEQLLDYWICLGRQEVDQALDIAMRMSDNQLTLYAYLKKLDLVSENKELGGQEKAKEMEEIKNKIKSLADALGIEYKEN